MFPTSTNSAKVHDIDAIHAELEILLNQCDKDNLINIFNKSEFTKSIMAWTNNKMCEQLTKELLAN